MNCHICHKNAEFNCQDCGEAVCDACMVGYTVQNPVDYDQCTECGDSHQETKANYIMLEEAKAEKRESDRLERNKKNREYYRRPEVKIRRETKKKDENERRKKEVEKMTFELLDSFSPKPSNP